jgi:hypothetical protein
VDHCIVPGTGRHGRARADALLAVIRNYACRVAVFGYDATRGDTFLVMTAARPVLDALGLLLPSVAASMESAARAATRGYAEAVRDALPRMSGGERRQALVTPYFRAYLRGYGLGVAETVRVLRAEVIAGEGEALAGLLAEDEARAEEQFTREFPGRKTLREERSWHRRGMEAGIRAGRMAGVDDGYLAIHDLVFAML